MIKNLDKLLEYQKIDIELRKILDEIERSEYNKKLEQARNEFNNAKTVITDSEKVAETIVSAYNAAMSAYEEAEAELAAVSDALAKTEDLEEQRKIVEKIEKLRDKLSEAERKLAEKNERTDGTIKTYLDGNERGKKMRAVHASVKEKFEQFKKEREPKINALKEKLAAIKPSIDPSVFKLYESITAERKYPAFVAAIPGEKKEYRCFCGFTLSLKTKSDLLDKGACRCETCQRVIYLKE